jgi:molybdate transport system substrate-binding protein
MLRFVKSPILSRNLAKALMRYAGIAALCMSAVVLATIRPPINQARAQFPELVVFADASLRGPLDEANVWFLYENGSGARATYGASMALAKQIEGGAPADIFFPADADSMNYLVERKLINTNSRDDVLSNKLVLIAPASSNVSMTIGQNFPLAQALGEGRLALGDPAASPDGKYGKAALEKLGVWSSVASRVTPAPDVRAALAMVGRGEAAFGIVYQTDAAADKNVKIVGTFPEASHPKIVYPAAITAKSTNIVSSVYVQFLVSNKAARYFEKYPGWVIL